MPIQFIKQLKVAWFRVSCNQSIRKLAVGLNVQPNIIQVALNWLQLYLQQQPESSLMVATL